MVGMWYKRSTTPLKVNTFYDTSLPMSAVSIYKQRLGEYVFVGHKLKKEARCNCKMIQHTRGIFSIPNIDRWSKFIIMPNNKTVCLLVGTKVLLSWLFLLPANVNTFTDFGECEVITQALAFTIRDD